jgi:type II restriction/modification system DNA methylase subunit YeeA
VDSEKLLKFMEFASKLKGYEKGEAQIFLDRLFIAFGQEGVIEASASLEHPIKIDDKTKFCDLIWPGKVLIEMKKRGEKLENHFSQAKEYWDNTYGERTEYVILCNFDEFWIYNWNLQKEAFDKVEISRLGERWRSLAFLSPDDIKPIFHNNLVKVTQEAADKIAQLYTDLIGRGIEKDIAIRFTLQCLVALFAEDTGLFPRSGYFYEVIEDCKNGQSSYDLFKLLFEQMNSKELAKGGRFKEIGFFNGGIFNEVVPIELTIDDLNLLSESSKHDWSKVQPSIFGNIFEDSIDEEEKHTTGAHYTYESDIMRIVEPTILRPWRKKIKSAKTLNELEEIHEELSNFKILDPACGSGNFLYLSFRELKHLELELIRRIIEKYPSKKLRHFHSKLKSNQFYGIDTNPLGIELAKVTLSFAKKFATDEFNEFTKQYRLMEHDEPLPFDNLDDNIIVADALFTNWPEVNAIIGNPPYQSKNKMQQEFGPEYMIKLHELYPDMSGREDYCIYWFRKAHDHLKENGRAGLVGTNTIRETYSREGGLDYIVSNGGDIEEAISTMPWSGKASVHVSIVNWIKGKSRKQRKVIAFQIGTKKDNPWREYTVQMIPSSLSPFTDVTSAKKINSNMKMKTCYQGQTHGHEGFLLSPEIAQELIKKDIKNKDVIFPYLNAEDIIGNIDSQPSRFVIDFQPRMSLFEVTPYKDCYQIVKDKVLPNMKKNAENERIKYADLKKKVTVRQQHLEKWWLFWRRRENLIRKITQIKRYIVCGQVTKRQIFEFVDSSIRPNAALMIFPFEDDYSFGILQSILHWEWFKARCSTLTERFRYTSQTVYETFIWPQWGNLTPLENSIKDTKNKNMKIELALNVAKSARKLRHIRNKIRKEYNYSLREIYRTLELPGKNPLKDAQRNLDQAVLKAYFYGLPKRMQKKDILEFLLELNLACADAEKNGVKIIGPGLPEFCKRKSDFYSDDCIKLK